VSGAYVAEGWALDMDFPNGQIFVHIYVDGKQSANYAGNCMTNLSRPDINSAFGVTGTHGFRCTIPSTFLDGNVHTLYVFAINVPTGNNPELVDSGTAFHQTGQNPVSNFTVTLDPTSKALVWNHQNYTNDSRFDYAPDGNARAMKNSSGTTFLSMPNEDNPVLSGTSTESLGQVSLTYSSFSSSHKIPELNYDYAHWLMSAYYKYGQIYRLAHHEWYDCLLAGDCGTGKNQFNSWVFSITRFVSSDGYSYSRNLQNGSGVALHAHTWPSTWHYDTDHHYGMGGPSNIVREGDYYYVFVDYLHRNLTTVAQDVFAPVLLRTQRIDLSADWEILGPNGFAPVSSFSEPYLSLTQFGGSMVCFSYNSALHKYLIMYPSYNSLGSLMYTSTATLANPVWSTPAVVVNSATFDTHTPYDPPFVDNSPGISAPNYPSVIDPDSPGRNYEYTDGQFFLYYSTNFTHLDPADYLGNRHRNLYRVRITVAPN
jgi:hypothetical protein